MRKWHCGINAYHKHSHVWIEDAPWYIFLLDDLVSLFCDFLHRAVPTIPLPNIKIKFDEEDEEKMTLTEAYGGLHGLFHHHVHDPIFNFCGCRVRHFVVETNFDELKEFACSLGDEEKEFWEAEIKNAKEMRQEDEEEEKENNGSADLE